MSRREKMAVDFFVVGAQKAGTTALFEYLRHHPEIALPPGKEMPFFSHDAIYRQGWASYVQRTFAYADAEHKWGTVTPQYMAGSVFRAAGATAPGIDYDERTVPARMYECAPTARIIALLRDPVERALSHFSMSAMNGLERRAAAVALAELLRPGKLQSARAFPSEDTGYVVWGEYGRILSGYLDFFPRAQILLLFTSELEQDAGETVRRICEFLAVSPDYVPPNLGGRYREGATARRLRWLRASDVRPTLARRRVLRAAWAVAPTFVRHRVEHTFDRTLYAVDLWNRRPGAAPDVDLSAMHDLLRRHYASDGLLLAERFCVAPPWLE